MQRLRYRIQSEAPLIFSARFGDTNMVATLRHVPGTSVAGMIAARYLREAQLKSAKALDDPGFYRTFVKGDVRFENAWPLLEDEADGPIRFFPVPNSVHQEKQGGKVYDLLHFDDDEEPEEQTKPVNGFCRIHDEEIRLAEVKTHLNFHHSRDRESGRPKKATISNRDRESGRPEEGNIFNYEAMDKGQVFEGEIIGGESDLRELVKICGTTWIGHMGRSRNAQYGKVRFDLIRPEPEPIPIPKDYPKDSKISLTLLSDTIIYNENGFSTTDPEALQSLLGGAIRIEKAFVKESDAETFLSVWRMKRPAETCFAAGSCFLLEGVTESDRDRLLDFQNRGIGERTHEGYGQCRFEWQQRNELDEWKADEPDIPRPEASMPETVKKILQRVVQDRVMGEAKLEAMNKAEAFGKRRPKNSLLGRLNGMVQRMDRDRFNRALKEELRDTARKQLEACRTDRQTLLGFLTEEKVSAAELFSKPNRSPLKNLAQEIGYDIEADAGFGAELYRHYLMTFFGALRKSEKEGEDG